MASEVRPKCFTAHGRSLPVMFSLLRIGQQGWVVLGVPAKTSIRPSDAPRLFKEGRKKVFKKVNTFAAEFLVFFTENRRFSRYFQTKITKLRSRLLIYCQINRSNGFFGVAFAPLLKILDSFFKKK